jgi:hypothetical protein
MPMSSRTAALKLALWLDGNFAGRPGHTEV